METNGLRSSALRKLRAAVLGAGLVALPWLPAAPGPAAPPPPPPDAERRAPGPPAARGGARRLSVAPELEGRNVEEIRVIGNRRVPTSAIRNLIRTRVGEPLDSDTAQDDLQRIFRELRRFSNVQVRGEPTAAGGVIVVFEVSEQQQVTRIDFRGNRKLEDQALRNAVDINVGEAIDPFRISIARNTIEALYQERNFPFAHVTVLPEPLRERGELVFDVVEGPNVRVRKVSVKGAKSFSEDQLERRIQTKSWVFVFNPGRYDPEQIDEDVASIRRFYEGKGFFDVRVGRKIVWSPDLTEAQVNFLVEEGPRYQVERVSFRFADGTQSLDESELRKRLRLREGSAFDAETLQRDVRQIVDAYSPFGYIYDPQSDDPDYLRVEPKWVFLAEPGKVEVVYTIDEGTPFHVGPVIIKGNYKSKDKLVLRELRIAPGELYDAGKVQDAAARLRAKPYFDFVNITPIGTDPDSRALLVEVNEAKTASFSLSAGINTNGGVGAGITYLQRNFDIANFPDSWREILSDRSFTGAGQTFRVSLEPGTEASNASILFAEPYLFDQPYSLTTEGYVRDRRRREYDDRRVGGRVTLGHRFNYTWSGAATLRGEDVMISNLDDPPLRAPEFLEQEGHNTLTSVTLSLKRDTVNPGVLPFKGTEANAAVEFFGALGGDYDFQKYTLEWVGYYLLDEDLTDRKTVLSLHGNAGYITGDSVFFERFYAGGIGSMRGFEFRGISPRSGLEDDPIGGDFLLTGTAEVGFPLVGENLRGVVFTDVGTVEEDFELGTIRSSVGAGVRLVVPFFGQAPIAIDFGYPLTKDDEDETQVISFSFGFVQ